MKLIKILLLTNNQILISQIEEVTSELGEPDCKLIKPHVIAIEYLPDSDTLALEPFMKGYTKQTTFMISSDKIVTLADPTPTLLEKYEDLIEE